MSCALLQACVRVPLCLCTPARVITPPWLTACSLQPQLCKSSAACTACGVLLLQPTPSCTQRLCLAHAYLSHLRLDAGGGSKQGAVAVAIARALVLGGYQREYVLKACAIAISNYGCSKIQTTLARKSPAHACYLLCCVLRGCITACIFVTALEPSEHHIASSVLCQPSCHGIVENLMQPAAVISHLCRSGPSRCRHSGLWQSLCRGNSGGHICEPVPGWSDSASHRYGQDQSRMLPNLMPAARFMRHQQDITGSSSSGTVAMSHCSILSRPAQSIARR